jgi:hypothetical protein
MSTDELAWVPEACSLPTVERPLRVAEFDALLTASLQAQERISRTRVRWFLDPDAEPSARDLTARETSCCSFFTFAISPVMPESGGLLQVDVSVPEQYSDVLDALQQRATDGSGR